MSSHYKVDKMSNEQAKKEGCWIQLSFSGIVSMQSPVFSYKSQKSVKQDHNLLM